MTDSNVSWLVSVPCNDTNFKTHLERATAAEVEQAIHEVEGQKYSKTKLTVLTRALRRKQKT